MRVRLALLAALLAPAALALAPGAAAQDAVLGFAADDAAMNAAMAKARLGLDGFFERQAHPGAGEDAFLVKFDLSRAGKGGDVEYIWAVVVGRHDHRTRVLLANDPVHPDFALGDSVDVEDDWIGDWSYRRRGVLQGGATMRVMLDRMTPEQAEEYRRSFGW